MPWIRFIESFDWVPPLMPMTAIAYKHGMVLFVTTPCAEAALLAGKAERAERPKGQSDVVR